MTRRRRFRSLVIGIDGYRLEGVDVECRTRRPVGASRDVVGDGASGFHAATEDQWVRARGRPPDDSDPRLRLGSAGRRRVQDPYSTEVQAPRVGALLRGLRP
jgi:hypothetical protein